MIFLNSASAHQEGYTKRELRRAKQAQRVYILLGRPSYRDFANIVKWKMIKNCPIEFQDVVNAWRIYGPDLGSVRGKSTQQKPDIVQTDRIVQIPQELIYQLQNITLCIDIMYMDKLVLFTFQ